MHGLFGIPLNLFLTMVAPPDPASLQSLEQGLDRIARQFDLSDRETRTLKDGLVEPFRQEGMHLGPDTVQWLLLVNRRLLALPPGVVSAGAELQWSTLGLQRYAEGLTLQQYLQGLDGRPAVEAGERVEESPTEAGAPVPPAEGSAPAPGPRSRPRRKPRGS